LGHPICQFLKLGDECAVLSRQLFRARPHCRDGCWRDLVLVGLPGCDGGFRLGGSQWLPWLVWMPAAQFRVGGYCCLPLLPGGCFPGGPVIHDGGERGFTFAVGVAYAPVAVGHHALLSCSPIVPVGLGYDRLGRIGSLGRVRDAYGGADLPQLITDPGGSPSALDRVSSAQLQQAAVRHAPETRARV
jgi:hypothetical protein